MTVAFESAPTNALCADAGSGGECLDQALPAAFAKLRVLSLFAGIGGFDLGLERTGGFETVAVAEVDPYASRVLAMRFPNAPNVGDVTKAVYPDADIICAGFPCQDISFAGAGAGLAGARSGLWREVVRAIRMVRPKLVLLENVAALLDRGLGDVLGDLAALGLHPEWHCIPAAYVGAPHIRDRVWIIAHSERIGWQEGVLLHRFLEEARGKAPVGQFGGVDGAAAWAEAIAGAGREDDGLPGDVDRLRCLGNAVVPQIPELIGNAILASMRSAEHDTPPIDDCCTDRDAGGKAYPVGAEGITNERPIGCDLSPWWRNSSRPGFVSWLTEVGRTGPASEGGDLNGAGATNNLHAQRCTP